ncbi:Uncharacterized protein APZ42_032002 [Daphnia magna]|uniref:Uncharacterized protein n=1 Tax=Daphnia magna TaxID=35525 RepID=A0A164MG78_9CRUS|nr:Uncharacterized protein APZ42_032002 [Daphnia magna]
MTFNYSHVRLDWRSCFFVFFLGVSSTENRKGTPTTGIFFTNKRNRSSSFFYFVFFYVHVNFPVCC